MSEDAIRGTAPGVVVEDRGRDGVRGAVRKWSGTVLEAGAAPPVAPAL